MASENEKLTLKFNMPAEYLPARARALYAIGVHDVPALSAANPMIDAAWMAALDAEIDTIYDGGTPAWAINAQAVATGAIDRLMPAAKAAMQELYHYAAMAWPGSRARQIAYGRGEYGYAIRSAPRMINLLDKAIAQAADDAAALDAVGFTAARRTAMETLMADLEAKYADREAAKGAARLATEQYYLRLNNLWDKLVLLNHTARIAFRDLLVRAEQYRLYEGRKPKKAAANIPIEEAVEQTSGMLKSAEAGG